MRHSNWANLAFFLGELVGDGAHTLDKIERSVGGSYIKLTTRTLPASLDTRRGVIA
jgi:hypothetical protein